MSFFDRLSGKEVLREDWLQLTSADQLNAAIEQSFNQTVVLFKHSTRCGISVGAKHALEGDWEFSSEDMVFYYLDLLNYREISNEIAEKTGVVHQSPQLIVLRNGKVVHSSTHHAINSTDLRAGLEKAAVA